MMFQYAVDSEENYSCYKTETAWVEHWHCGRLPLATLAQHESGGDGHFRNGVGKYLCVQNDNVLLCYVVCGFRRDQSVKWDEKKHEGWWQHCDRIPGRAETFPFSFFTLPWMRQLWWVSLFPLCIEVLFRTCIELAGLAQLVRASVS